MVKKKEQTFKLLPEWIIKQSGKSLIISGGADAKYEIELDISDSSFFSSIKNYSSFTRNDLDAIDQRVLEELITAEIVVPEYQKNKAIKIAVLGDINKFNIDSRPDMTIVESNQNYDLALVVRANCTYAELLEKINYQDITKPHLLVELAFHHTFSVGPLVFPGETACVACLQGRISTRWGDDTPPGSPKIIQNYGKLAAELVTAEVARIARGDTSLTNKTFSWNFQDRVTKKDQLLKVPLCPICTQNKIDRDGSIALPWSKDESITDTI